MVTRTNKSRHIHFSFCADSDANFVSTIIDITYFQVTVHQDRLNASKK